MVRLTAEFAKLLRRLKPSPTQGLLPEELSLVGRIPPTGSRNLVEETPPNALREIDLLRACLYVKQLRREGNARWRTEANRIVDELEQFPRSLRGRVTARLTTVLSTPLRSPASKE